MALPFSDISTIKICWARNPLENIPLLTDCSAIYYPITYVGQPLPSSPTQPVLPSSDWEVVPPEFLSNRTGTTDVSCILASGLTYGYKYVLGISDTNLQGAGPFTTTMTIVSPLAVDTSYICGTQPSIPKFDMSAYPLPYTADLGSIDLSWLDPSLAFPTLWKPTDMSFREFRIYYQKTHDKDVQIPLMDISFDSSYGRYSSLEQLPNKSLIENPDGNRLNYDICGTYTFKLTAAANFFESSYNGDFGGPPASPSDISWSIFFPAEPAKPDNIILSKADASSINVDWTQPTDTGGGSHTDICDADVQYYDISNLPPNWIPSQHPQLGTTSEVNVTGLTYGNAYEFKVRVQNDVSYSEFDIGDLSIVCGIPPYYPKFDNSGWPIPERHVSLGSVDLSWLDPSINASVYSPSSWIPTDMSFHEFKVYYQKTHQSDNPISTIDFAFDSSYAKDISQATLPNKDLITNPDGNTSNYDICGTYKFGITAGAGFIESSYNDASINIFFPGEPDQPHDIILTVIDPSTIDVSWNRPLYTGGGTHTAIRDTNVQYYDVSELPIPTWTTFEPPYPLGNDISLNVTGLTYGNAYYFKARSKNDVSYSEFDIYDSSIVCGVAPLALSAFKPNFLGITGQPGVENWMYYAKQGGKIVWNSGISRQYPYNDGGIDISWVNPIDDNWVEGWSDTDMSFNSYVLYRSKEAIGFTNILEDNPVVEMVSTWLDNDNEISFNKFDLSASINTSNPHPNYFYRRLGQPNYIYRFSLVPQTGFLKAPFTTTFDIQIGYYGIGSPVTSVTYPNLFRLPENVFNYQSHYPNYPTDFSCIWYRDEIAVRGVPTGGTSTGGFGRGRAGYYCNLWNQKSSWTYFTGVHYHILTCDFSLVTQNMRYPWGTIHGDGHRDFSTNPVLASAYKTSYTNAAEDGFLTSTTPEQSLDIAWNVGIGSGTDSSLCACRGEIPWLLVNYEIGGVDPSYSLLENTDMWIDISYTDSDGVSYFFEEVFATGYKGVVYPRDLSGKYQQGNYMGYMDINPNADLSNSYKNEPRFSRTMNLYVHGSTYDLCDNLIPEDQPGGITGYKPHIDSHNKKSSAVQFNQGVFALQPLCMTPTYTNLGLGSWDLSKQLYRLCDSSNYQLRYGINGEGYGTLWNTSYSNWLTPPKTPYAKVNFPCWVINPEHIDISGFRYYNDIDTKSRHGGPGSATAGLWNDTWCGFYFGYNFSPPTNITNHGYYSQFIWDVSWTISICLKEGTNYRPIHVYQGFTRPQKKIDYNLEYQAGFTLDWGQTDLLGLWEYQDPLEFQGGSATAGGYTGYGGAYQFRDSSLNHYAYPNNFGDPAAEGVFGDGGIAPPEGPNTSHGWPIQDSAWMQGMICGGPKEFTERMWTQPPYNELTNDIILWGAPLGSSFPRGYKDYGNSSPSFKPFCPVPSAQVCNYRVATKPSETAIDNSYDTLTNSPLPAPTMNPWPWPSSPSNESYVTPWFDDYPAPITDTTNLLAIDYETTAIRFQGASPAWESNYFIRVDMQFKTCAQRLMECYDHHGYSYQGYWGKTASQCFELIEGSTPPSSASSVATLHNYPLFTPGPKLT